AVTVRRSAGRADHEIDGITADGSHRLGMLSDKYRNIDREGSRRAFDGAHCVGDEHAVGSRMGECGIGDDEGRTGYAEIVRAVRDVRSIESPLISQRAAAEGLNAEVEIRER